VQFKYAFPHTGLLFVKVNGLSFDPYHEKSTFAENVACDELCHYAIYAYLFKHNTSGAAIDATYR